MENSHEKCDDPTRRSPGRSRHAKCYPPKNEYRDSGYRDSHYLLDILFLSWSSPLQHAYYSSQLPCSLPQMNPSLPNTSGRVQRFEQSVVCAIMTANTTNCYDNSVCPYSLFYSLFCLNTYLFGGGFGVGEGDGDGVGVVSSVGSALH